MANIAVVSYPGSFGVPELQQSFKAAFDQELKVVWHDQQKIPDVDAVILPGGSSFGDFLRPGALAKVSAISGIVKRFAQDGGRVLGIGNGFQILCELGVLPGVLLENAGGRFINEEVHHLVEESICEFTKTFEVAEVISLPLACRFGRFYLDPKTLQDIEENNQVVFRLCDKEGEVDPEKPLNGAVHAIAALTSRQGNVLGMMGHPERAIEEDGVGAKLFREFLSLPPIAR